MKIEELFGKVSSEEECSTTPVQTQSRSREQKPLAASKQNIDSKTKVFPVKSAKAHLCIDKGKKSKQNRSKMRLDQISRHEEHSYLLDAETNQAILDNAVSKDELCRYLTPLKFIEIDSWRKDVPYGLTQESDTDRRKWRTPLEILLGKPDSNQDAANNQQRRDSIKRQAGPSFSTQNSRRNSQTKKNRESSAVRQDVQQNNKTFVDVSSRPATSPHKDAILKRINSEKLLVRRRNSAVVGSTHKDNPMIGFGIKSKLYSSYEGLHVSGSYYDRPAVSSTPSLRRATSASQDRKIHPLYVNQSNQINPDTANQQTFTNHTTTVTSLQSSFRPRTRGGKEERYMPPETSSRNTGVFSTREQFSQPQPTSNLQSIYSDPNVAYAPHTLRRARSGIKKHVINSKVLNYYETAQNQKSTSSNDGQNWSTRAHNHNEHNDARTAQVPISLPRGSLFSSNHSTPRQSSTTPRAVFETNQLITGNWSPKPSAWVAQALPDLTSSDAKARAERDGYYVRKPSKAVTFKLKEPSVDHIQPHNILDDATGSKKDISMVVVNVDGPKMPSKNILSRGGTVGVRGKTNTFVNGNIISVRP